ncbi:ankyrin repeat domain-containing protein [Tunturiibacter psychrotolerans]|uniref:ankyrin repeat domain-containing protein n=1 Tax=Tunturiibacter psychrotolerans TaxID=3069686 RepID=UPI003D9B0859
MPHLRETAEECASLILKAGADVHARDKNGYTPLHHAGSPSIAALLLAAGADINARNNNDETPIFTTYSDDLMRFYIKHGADLTVRDNQGRSIQEALAAKHLLLSPDLNATLATQITPKQ